MKDWIPLIIFFTIFLTSLIFRILASENLLEEYSDERSNVLLNTKGSWHLNKEMFNKKGKYFFNISNGFGFVWIIYIIIIVIYNSAIM